MRKGMKKLMISLFVILHVAAHAQSFSENMAKRNYALLGQTAPSDMVLVKGNDKMHSFYMSVQEEPNINYVIYLKWMIHVFSNDYPEAVKNALPVNPGDTVLGASSNAFFLNYLTNPEYAYYPVVNLTWKQIQNYLIWKTDRLNEMILIKNKLLRFNPDQQNEDNFNTAAYLAGQYEGLVYYPKNVDWQKYTPDRITEADHALFPEFRLPTEAEWDYANKTMGVSPDKVDKKAKRKLLDHPFGKDYYTLEWGKNNWNQNCYDDNPHCISFNMGSLILNQSIYYDVNPNSFDKSSYSNKMMDTLFQTISNYPTDVYGLINMQGGVMERVMDEYKESPPQEVDYLSVCRTQGALLGDPVLENLKVRVDVFKQKKSHYYDYSLRDSVLGWRFFRLRTYDTIIPSFSISMKQFYFYPDGSGNIKKDSLGRMRYRLAEIDSSGSYKKIFLSFEENMKNFYLFKNVLIDSVGHISEDNSFDLRQVPKNRIRVVKGGTWSHTGNFRMAMSDSLASNMVGFRCILPYSGVPITKKYKVKWGLDLPFPDIDKATKRRKRNEKISHWGYQKWLRVKRRVDYIMHKKDYQPNQY